MNGRQIFSIHIVLKCQRSSEAQTFARLQYFCTFVIEIKDRMQYCTEEPKRGCRARALGTRSLYALRAALMLNNFLHWQSCHYHIVYWLSCFQRYHYWDATWVSWRHELFFQQLVHINNKGNIRLRAWRHHNTAGNRSTFSCFSLFALKHTPFLFGYFSS